MEQGKYSGPQPRIMAAPIENIGSGLGMDICPNGINVQKYEKLIGKRGNILPITVTHAVNGALVLAGGHDTFSAYQNCGTGEVPCIIAETTDESDILLLMLDITLANQANYLAISSCICKLIDEYSVPRKEIANILNKSLPWISLAERISRRLTPAVKEMLSNGAVCMRSAVEIALLPADVQKPFADRAVSLALNKRQVSQLVSLYTNEKCSKRVKENILNDPVECLKAAQKKSSQTGYALFNSTLQRCRAVLHELFKMITALPDSAIDEACAQLRELLAYAVDMLELPQDDFARVNGERFE